MPPFLTAKTMGLALWVWLLIILAVAGGGGWYLASQPVQASWRYGVCRAFLDQYVRFPTTVKIEQGGETRGSAYMTFFDTNPFGAQQVRVFECYFNEDAQGRVTLSRITMDRKSIPQDYVDKYNAQIPVLASQKLDTALPGDLPSNIEDLKD
jgi:hypothetical protein